MPLVSWVGGVGGVGGLVDVFFKGKWVTRFVSKSVLIVGCCFFFGKVTKAFFPQTVCPHYGVLTVGVRSGVLRGVLLPLLVSTAQARTEFRLRRQCRTDLWARDFGSFYRVSVHFLKQNVVLRDRCRRSDGFGGSKREFTWQVQGIGHIVKIVDVAKTLAGVCHSKDCVLRGRHREYAPWILYFEVKGLNS